MRKVPPVSQDTERVLKNDGRELVGAQRILLDCRGRESRDVTGRSREDVIGPSPA